LGLEKLKEMEEKSDPLKESLVQATEEKTVTKKERKPFEWTPKRKEAFDKMREGLQNKVEITKQIKLEKKLSEKEAIKQRVRAIMEQNSASSSAEIKETKGKKKKGHIEVEAESSSGSESSEEEVKPKKKKNVPKKKPSSKKKRHISSSEESDSPSEEESSEEEEYRGRDPRSSYKHGGKLVYSEKEKKRFDADRRGAGKASRQYPFTNPLDQFILL
jgi:hypothetical protein